MEDEEKAVQHEEKRENFLLSNRALYQGKNGTEGKK